MANAEFDLNTGLNDAAIKVTGSAPWFSHIQVTNIRSSGMYLDGPALLEDSRICDNFVWGILVSESATIKGNIICNNRSMGIRLISGSPAITQNLVTGNNWAIGDFWGGISIELQRLPGAPVLRHNTIANNFGYGIRIQGAFVSREMVITQNAIFNNDRFNIRLGETPRDLILTGNYWGSSDRNVIREKFYDNSFNFRLNDVVFLPMLGVAPEEAPDFTP